MSNTLINSKKQKEDIEHILSKKVPSYRQAYSDRTAFVMACMSELAYIRFNPLLRGISLDYLMKKMSTLEGSINLKKVESIGIKNKLKNVLDLVSYDHEQEKEGLIQELGSIKYKLIETFDSDGTQAILVANDEHAVLAFRGTEATSIKDIKSDAKATTKGDDSGGKIHSGFEEAYQKVAFDIEKALDTKPVKDKSLFITGHSLGGALATIAAKKITHRAGNAACYTYGSPRVGDKEWIANIKTPMYRLVNAADCVTMLPPSTVVINSIGWVFGFLPIIGKPFRAWVLSNFDGYLHGGDMKYLTNCAAGNYKEVKLLYAVSWIYRMKAFIVKKLPWKKMLSDHSISVYRKKLLIIAKQRNLGKSISTDRTEANG